MAEPRFLTLADVAEVLNTSSAQVYALVRSGELAAIRIGGRGQWRVERSALEDYIARMYEATRDYVRTNPLHERLDAERVGDRAQARADESDGVGPGADRSAR